MTGTVLGNRYTIYEELGTGGTATVYRAHCAYLQRDVAIKVLRKELRTNTELVHRFESEARAAASLTHPNIVQIYDVGKENGVDYIVMELVEGRSLKELLSEHGAMPWQMAVDVMIKVASALQRAHAKKIVHRDIKPQNILLTLDGEPKVADFGIARIASTGMETVKVDTVASVHYASPEQVRGGYTDAQSDLYSAGITLYEMLTGTLPFAGDNPVSVALRHIQDAVPRVDELKPGIPSALADVVETLMQKKRADRYQDAASLIADLTLIRRDPQATVVKRGAAHAGLTDVVVSASHKDEDMADILEIPVHREAISSHPSGLIQEEGFMRTTSSRRSPTRNERRFNPRKLLLPLVYVGLIALIIGLVFGIIRFVSRGLGASPSPAASESATATTGRQEFLVGTYNGQPLQTVLDALPEGLAHEVIYIEDNSVGKDHVVRQSPSAGSNIVVGGLTTLKLYVSSGVETVMLPAIDDMKRTDMLLLLRDQLGLVVEQKFEYSKTIPVDGVIRLEPASGTEMKKGEKVILVGSLGEEQKSVSMPDLSNLDRKTVEAKLAEYLLAVGTITPNDTPLTGAKLVSQSINPGDLVPEGTQVNLTFEQLQVEPTPLPTTEPTGEPSAPPTPTDSGPTLAKVTIPVDWHEEWNGNSVQLTVIVYSKQSGLDEVVLDAKIKESDFPYPVLITIPDGGGTVRIYVDNSLHKEKDI